MKKSLLILLSVAVMVSCKNETPSNPATGTIQVSGGATGGNATVLSSNGSPVHATLVFNIPFSITAMGKEAYIPSNAVAASSPSAAHAIQFSIDNAAGANQAVGMGSIVYVGNDGQLFYHDGNYIIPAGQTKEFVLQITYVANGAASYRASLININWSSVDFTDAGHATMFTTGFSSSSFKTNYVAAQ